MENSCIRYIANYISARIFMYVHKISFNELYVMPLCPFIYFIYLIKIYVLIYNYVYITLVSNFSLFSRFKTKVNC